MLINRITAYLEEITEPPISGAGPTASNTVMEPPTSFAPVPAALLGPLPQQHASWQEQLYRMAYEAAKAALTQRPGRRNTPAGTSVHQGRAYRRRSANLRLRFL
jgi:hypothetical protein